MVEILIGKVLPAIGDICLFFISVYTFRLTIFPKKLRFIGFRPSFSTFDGNSLEITLENRALSPVVVQAISLVQDDYCVKIFSEDDENCETCIIDGFKTAKIKMIPYSQISCDGAELNFHNFKKMYLVVETPRGKQYLNFARGPQKRFLWIQEKLHPPKSARVVRDYINGKIVKPYIRYAVIYVDKSGNQHTVFIHKAGVMSEMLFGHNTLPKEIIDDREKLYEYFEKEFSQYDIPFGIKGLNNKNRRLIIPDDQ